MLSLLFLSASFFVFFLVSVRNVSYSSHLLRNHKVHLHVALYFFVSFVMYIYLFLICNNMSYLFITLSTITLFYLFRKTQIINEWIVINCDRQIVRFILQIWRVPWKLLSRIIAAFGFQLTLSKEWMMLYNFISYSSMAFSHLKSASRRTVQ